MESRDADPQRVERLTRLLDALHFAGPDAAAAALSGLAEPDLAAALLRTEHPLAVAVCDHVLALPPGPAAAVLGARAMRGETLADSGAVLRALLRFADPQLDEALFFPFGAAAPWWVRRAIVRDRRGPDGRALISPALRERLLVQVERIGERLAAGSRDYTTAVEKDLLNAALCADDPALALAALPHGAVTENGGGVLRAVATLRAHGTAADLTDERLHKSLTAHRSTRQATVWELARRVAEGGSPEVSDAAVEDGLFAVYGGHRRWVADRLPRRSGEWAAQGTCSERLTVPWDLVTAFAAAHPGQTFTGLDEAAAREDAPADVRAALTALYPRAALFVPTPDAAALLTAQQVAGTTLNPASRHFAIRQILLRGLARGSLGAADALRYATPAAEVLGLAAATTAAVETYYRERRTPAHEEHEDRRAWWKESDDTAQDRSRQPRRPAFTSGDPIPAAAHQAIRAELRAAIGARLDATVAADPAKWLTLLTRIGGWPESLDALLDRMADPDGGRPPTPSGRAHRWPRGVDPAAVLLGFAPEGTVDSLLAEDSPMVQGLLVRVLDRGPIPDTLIDYALGDDAARPGRTALRRALARNPETGLGRLWQLVEREPAEPEVLAAAYFHRRATEDLRSRIILRSEAAGGLHRRLVARLATIEADLQLLRPALASEDPLLVHALLRRVNSRIDPGHRAVAYAGLARQSGPEPVWALELERVGTLEKSAAAVRASMAAGDAESLFEAADAAKPPSFLAEEIRGLTAGAPVALQPDAAEQARAVLRSWLEDRER